MLLAFEALGIELCDVLGARRARGEPAVLACDLEAANGRIVAWCARQLLQNRISGEFGFCDRVWRQDFQRRFLFWSGGCVDAGVIRDAELLFQFAIVLARILSGAGGDFGREEAHDETILIGGPDFAVAAQKAGAGAFLAAEAAGSIEKSRREPFEANRYFPELSFGIGTTRSMMRLETRVLPMTASFGQSVRLPNR